MSEILITCCCCNQQCARDEVTLGSDSEWYCYSCLEKLEGETEDE